MKNFKELLSERAWVVSESVEENQEQYLQISNNIDEGKELQPTEKELMLPIMETSIENTEEGSQLQSLYIEAINYLKN